MSVTTENKKIFLDAWKNRKTEDGKRLLAKMVTEEKKFDYFSVLTPDQKVTLEKIVADYKPIQLESDSDVINFDRVADIRPQTTTLPSNSPNLDHPTLDPPIVVRSVVPIKKTFDQHMDDYVNDRITSDQMCKFMLINGISDSQITVDDPRNADKIELLKTQCYNMWEKDIQVREEKLQERALGKLNMTDLKEANELLSFYYRQYVDRENNIRKFVTVALEKGAPKPFLYRYIKTRKASGTSDKDLLDSILIIINDVLDDVASYENFVKYAITIVTAGLIGVTSVINESGPFIPVAILGIIQTGLNVFFVILLRFANSYRVTQLTGESIYSDVIDLRTPKERLIYFIKI